MKKALPLFCALAFAVSAFAQESEKTTIKTTETKVPAKTGGVNTIDELWAFQDAVPVEQGRLELRLTTRWETAQAPANRGDSNDDFVFIPSLVWGAAENLELSINVPLWLGDGGKIPGQADGYADTYIGTLWRLSDQVDYWPAFALGGEVRIPTGNRSDGLDAELRLVATNEYASGIRSHFNVYAKTVNTTNGVNTGNNEQQAQNRGFLITDSDDPNQVDPDPRHFQYGAVIGLDGPLCADGSVRWVLDYINKSSSFYGHSNSNLLDVGWEWQVSDASTVGMSVLVGLDDNEETPNFGSAITWAQALTY